MVGEPAQQGRGADADAAGASEPLGRRNCFPLAAIRGEEVEKLGRLGDHRTNSLCSMNLVGSKLIERTHRLSSKICETGVSWW
jgi:hypothetical protein